MLLFEAGHVSAGGVGEAAVDDAVLADPEALLLAVLDCALGELEVAVAEDAPSPTNLAPQTPPLGTAGPRRLFR